MSDIDPRKIVDWAYRTGHFWSPDNPDGANVRLNDLSKLSLRDDVTRRAIASAQGFMSNPLESIVQREHGRAMVADGNVGPATDALANFPRCGHPDWPPPTDEHAADLRAYWGLSASARFAPATGSGSWPAGCLPEFPGIHVVRVDVDDTRMPAATRSNWDWIKQETIRAYAEIGVLVRYVAHGQPSEVDMEWRVLRGSTIGLAEFNSGACRDNVFHYEDPGYSASKELLTTLHMHELGHNVNLQHTRGGIMNPSIIRTALDWSDDPSYSSLKRYFGGQPINVPDVPLPPMPLPPVTPSPGGTIEIHEEITLNGRSHMLHIVPKV